MTSFPASGNITSDSSVAPTAVTTLSKSTYTSININGLYYWSGSVGSSSTNGTFDANGKKIGGTVCLVAGTLITLANGTLKKVEDIIAGDEVLVFNHFTGTYDKSMIMYNVHSELDWDMYTVMNLEFSDGSKTRYHNQHYFFNIDLNKYVLLDHSNYKDYIGHRFYTASYDGQIYTSKVLTLTNAYETQEYTGVYGPMTAGHLNLFSDGFLSIAGDNDPFVNIFELDENMKYDEKLMQEDIEKYGLFTYDDFKDYISEDIYNAYQGQYLRVAIGKGYTTFERILELINKYLSESEYLKNN